MHARFVRDIGRAGAAGLRIVDADGVATGAGLLSPSPVAVPRIDLARLTATDAAGDSWSRAVGGKRKADDALTTAVVATAPATATAAFLTAVTAIAPAPPKRAKHD